MAPYPSSRAHSAWSSRPNRAVSEMTMPTSRPGVVRGRSDAPSSGFSPPGVPASGAPLRRVASTSRSASSAGTESFAPAARRDSALRWRACITPAASIPRSTALTWAIPSASGVIVTWRDRAARSARSRDFSGSSCWISICTSERSFRSPAPVSAIGFAPTSSSRRAMVSGSAWDRARDRVDAVRAGNRPVRRAPWTSGIWATRRRADAREKEDEAEETRRACPISWAAPLPC